MKNIDYEKLFELIILEVKFWQNIKNARSKFERSKIFDDFYPSFIEKVKSVFGTYGGFDERIVDVIFHCCKNKDILELGCGDSKLSHLLGSTVNSYVGVDISVNNYKNKNYEIIKQNLILFDNNFLKDKKFDIIYSNDFVEHLYEEDLYNLMDFLIKNHLKKNGIIITITPSFLTGHKDSIDYLNIPKGLLFGTHLTVKSAKEWEIFFNNWGGVSKIYCNSYKTAKFFKNIDLFLLPPSAHDFIIKSRIRNFFRISEGVVMKTIFKE